MLYPLSYERRVVSGQFTAPPSASPGPPRSRTRGSLSALGGNLLGPPDLMRHPTVTGERHDPTNEDAEAHELLAEIAFAKLAKARRAPRSGGPRRAPGTAPAAAALIDLREGAEVPPAPESTETESAVCH